MDREERQFLMTVKGHKLKDSRDCSNCSFDKIDLAVCGDFCRDEGRFSVISIEEIKDQVDEQPKMEPKETNKKKFRVGDKVSTEANGVGVYARFVENSTYPIRVTFEHGYETFTEDGKRHINDKNSTLHHDDKGDIDYSVIKDVLPVRKKTVWINLYQRSDGVIVAGSCNFDTEGKAKGSAASSLLTTISLEIDE